MTISLVGCQTAPTPEPTTTLPPISTLEPTSIATTQPTLPPTPTLPPPSKPALEPAEKTQVEPSQTITIKAVSESADRFEWNLDGPGQISSTGPQEIIRYTAPEQGNTVAIVTVTAFNSQGASSPTSLEINILPISIAGVPLDALAIPAGWMSGGTSPESYISLSRGSPGICRKGKDCLKVVYRSGGQFGGIFWWPTGCGESGTNEVWDRVRRGACGVNVLEMGKLSTVNRLSFWAKGDQGGEVIEFKIGSVDLLPSPGRSIGKVTLTRDWSSHEIDLEGVDLANAVALFAWIAADIDNPQGAAFYLADIQFIGIR